MEQASKNKVMLAATALMLTCNLALAEGTQAVPPQAGNTPAFSQLDKNKDGYVDNKEAMASPELSKTFKQADTDKNNKLSPGEFKAALKPLPHVKSAS